VVAEDRGGGMCHLLTRAVKHIMNLNIYIYIKRQRAKRGSDYPEERFEDVCTTLCDLRRPLPTRLTYVIAPTYANFERPS
jgi:hypothetical protein